MRNAAGADTVPVLTFHSISPRRGPTSIAPETFRMQMDVLAQSGFRSLTCDEFLAWREGARADAVPRVLLTFDDGYADFASAAHPVLAGHGYSAIVFLPTGRVGAREDWRGATAAARALMDWATVTELARAGIEFGGHGATHADLTRLSAAERREEIDGSAQQLTERLGRRPACFAPPYGRVNAEVIGDIERVYDVAFGTRFACATRTGDRFDVPRIEMHYFRDERRWRDFLAGRRGYFLARRALRWVKFAAERIVDPGRR
jgi:peptidoglycan/xylan/chitin deacetylase (PgdA/CDA1 family)